VTVRVVFNKLYWVYITLSPSATRFLTVRVDYETTRDNGSWN